ncbi:hypothetical protein LEMLEM_LOCUS10417 [Lemmus lemmus]
MEFHNHVRLCPIMISLGIRHSKYTNIKEEEKRKAKPTRSTRPSLPPSH